MLRRVQPPTPSSHRGEAGDTVHDLRDDVASLQENYHRWVLHPRWPSDSHDPADHHQNDL